MKLGLIAMSGVRCQNSELLALGLTLPGFVERSKVIASLPSLGLLTLAGLTPPSVEVDYLEVPDLAAVGGLPGTFDAVAISSFTAQMTQAYALADRYRAAGVKVILGGLHVTALPDEAALHADAVVVGEGEPAWPTVVTDLEHGRLRLRYDTRNTRYNLAEGPLPRFDLLKIDRYNRLTIQTQRGCPYNCEFCGASIRLAPGYRAKPVARVLEELHQIKELWPNPFIEFADDNTFADKRRGRELARALIPEGIRWFTETDISIADDPVLLELLKESGCAQILVGLEAPTAREVDGIERKANWKRAQADRYREAIQRIQDAGITVNGCFVLGLENQDRTAFDRVFEFVRETGLYEVQVTVMTAFPGSPLYDRLLAEGRLLDADAWETCTLFDVNFQPRLMTVAELESGFRELGCRLYDRDFIEARRRGFFQRQNDLRQARAVSAESGRAAACAA
jgi:radical SAM superfamily enzyme YgiQ (UPF0313 family)